MNLDVVQTLAAALLYEGYVLYPYRPSSIKNRLRFNFGVVVPEASESAHRGEAYSMQTECLAYGSNDTRVEVRVRFLHLLAREVERAVACSGPEQTDGAWETVESLDVDGQLHQTWDEAVEREIVVPLQSLSGLTRQALVLRFTFDSTCDEEHLVDAKRSVAGRVLRRQAALEGVVEMNAVESGEGLNRLTVRITNQTQADTSPHERDLLRSLVSTHTIIGLDGGKFVSLLEPPDELRTAAESCHSIGTWPVLVGEPGSSDVILSSPIILYDYPEIAAESAGDLCDATEIDEILNLRILTLTDDEKRQMRSTDERSRRILERAESIPAEQFMKLHGAIRGLRTVKEDR